MSVIRRYTHTEIKRVGGRVKQLEIYITQTMRCVWTHWLSLSVHSHINTHTHGRCSSSEQWTSHLATKQFELDKRMLVFVVYYMWVCVFVACKKRLLLVISVAFERVAPNHNNFIFVAENKRREDFVRGSGGRTFCQFSSMLR